MQENLFDAPSMHELNTQITISKSVLKSGLQKAVRKCQPDNAIKIAKSFIALDATECLRRLPIITMEDVMLHPDMDKLVELYRSSSRKSFNLSDEDRNFVLRYVWEIANTEYRDDFWKNNADGREVPDLTKLTDKQKSLSEQIEYRASAGGLAEDPPMLRHQLRGWQYRWTVKGMSLDDVEQFFEKAPDLDWNDIDYAQISDIELNSYDMHVMGGAYIRLIGNKPYVQEACARLFPNNDIGEVLGHLVWRYWVATNHKTQIGHGRTIDWFVDEGRVNPFPESTRPQMDELWTIVEADCHSLSEWVRKKRANGGGK